MAAAKPKIIRKAGKQRYGKGFSRDELKRAGLSLKEALSFGVPVDSRRKSAHEENVKVVKTFLESKKARPKSRGKSKS
jgi:large subunit ribosomal protein L13e